MMNTDVSIIIVNWNTRDILRNCLASVYEQTRDIICEVIVIDNASSDGSTEMVKREFPQTILIANTENRGFAAANNQGMRIAQGRYILLLNSDTVVLDGAIQKCVVFAEQHPEAAVTGCRVLNPDRTLQPTCFMYPSLLNLVLSSTYLYKLFPRNTFFGRELMSWWDRSDMREVEVVTGCFMLVRKNAMDQVGMMDESYFMYAEETDWCYRFHRAGWSNLFYPGAQIIHLGGQSSRQIRVKSLIQVRLGILRFFLKNKNHVVFWLAGFLISLFFMFRVPLWFLLSILKPSDCERNNRLKAYASGWCKVIKAVFIPKVENFKV
jgi:GT2 family glycosyltransferase